MWRVSDAPALPMSSSKVWKGTATSSALGPVISETGPSTAKSLVGSSPQPVNESATADAPAARPRRHADVAAVGGHDFAREEQAEARGARDAARHLEVLLEDRLPVLGRHPRSLVGHLETHRVRVGPRAEDDRPSLGAHPD